MAYGRGAAERLAASIPIPRGTGEIVLAIGEVHNISAFVEFLGCMLRRLSTSVILTVSLPRTKLLERADQWLRQCFDDPRLRIQMR